MELFNHEFITTFFGSVVYYVHIITLYYRGTNFIGQTICTRITYLLIIKSLLIYLVHFRRCNSIIYFVRLEQKMEVLKSFTREK